ncbi:MAG TPA: glycosyltransferase, partial [Bacteroidales bacterium]|nr:glycosyltransferase [Bacteroidales bacterium]
NVVIVQGSGLNTGRGTEELIMAMQPEYGVANARLLIIGDGNARHHLIQLVKSRKLENRVIFLPRMPYDLLLKHTARATIGVSLDKPFCLNYKYSLPNKLFDYIMSGTPVLVSDLPEVRRIVEDYGVGLIAQSHEPAKIASCINEMLSERERLSAWKRNCLKAAHSLNWEKEEKTIRQIYSRFRIDS